MENNDIKDPNAVEETPHIPIKTYQWEDVKRSRKKGGYPWTHLTKPPFDEEIDAETFTMDAYRRSRSSSTLGKCSLQEISEGEQVDDISDQEKNADTQGLHDINPQSIIAKSEESCVNKKELSPPETAITIHIQTEDLTEINENLLNVSNSNICASSEGPSKKRKLSVESSHSRISLSKLAIKDKLKSAKEKLKLPKLIKRSKSDVQVTKKPKVQKTENKRISYYQGKSEPVYIHIPLKLPPGETDEYSKYELESRPTSRSASLTHLTHFGSGKRKLSLLGLLTELKRLYDDQVVASESKPEQPSDETSSNNEKIDTKNLPEKFNIDEFIDKRKHKLKRSSKRSTQELKEMLAASPDTNEISQYLDKDDKYEIITTEIPNLDIDCVIITDYDEPSEDKENHSNLHEPPDGDSELNLNKDIPPRVRAKSEEPKRKRKSSIDSSYSRKSLSKLAFMKKIKNVKDSIKLPKFLSFPKLDTNPKITTSKSTEITTNIPKQSEVKINKKISDQPLYIHIPLKLPEGQQDEFSHLAGTDQKQPTNISKQVETVPECETPISPVASGSDVQLIFLTPPSDDEILDSNIPETPSETNQKFFESLKVDELKSIAKKAVDHIYPDKKLEVVKEDIKTENDDLNAGIATEEGTTYWQMHPVLVDEEDGLKLSDAAIAMIQEEMAKELKIDKEEPKPSPQLKKKVSFKRARAQDGERIYEDVGLSVDKPPVEENATFRSMSTEEEKSYLDEKVVKTTSLDEDYNKWSQITDHDHEYEPVLPPPDEKIKLPVLTNAETTITLEQPKHITFNEQLTSNISTKIHMETPTAQVFQDEVEDRFFKSSPVVALPQMTSRNKPLPTTEPLQSTKTDTKKKENSNNQHSRGNKFNNAIKTQAEKIKSTLQNIKRPHINLPQPPKFSTATLSKLKFKKPKMPELPSIKIASLKRNDSKNSWRKRQLSTESNAGDSKTKKFSFKTYPRIFEKSKVLKQSSFCDSFDKTTPNPVFATVPRVKTKAQKELVNEITKKEEDEEPKEYYYDKDGGFVTIPIDQDSNDGLHLQSPVQYNHEDIKIDDTYHGSGDDTELSPKGNLGKWKKEETKPYYSSNINRNVGELQSDQSSASLSDHRQGVLEEIDSDQFFLREKGISQDDIDVGQYLSSEIKEAFRNPINALKHFQSEEREYDVDITDQSQSSEEIPKRKWIKKPKRKKTPHVSNEQLSFEFGSDPEDYATKHKIEYTVQAPTRPKRRSKRSKQKKSELDSTVPYQETIPFVEPQTEQLDFIDSNQALAGEVIEYVESSDTYKNESGTTDHFYINTQNEEPEMSVPMYINTCDDIENEIIAIVQPIRPVRKNKNVRNLNAIEVDSSADRDFSLERSINGFEESARIEDTGYQNTPPSRPDRKRSHTRSESENSFLEKFPIDTECLPVRPIRLRSNIRSKSTPSMQDNMPKTPPPVRPVRLRSRTRSESTESLPGSQDLSLLLETNAPEVICIEETCIQIICDPMGYAVIDKTKIRDPPLPPPRCPETPPRTRRKKKHSTSGKFATVPRPPSRPLRNYSTLNKPTSTSNNNIFDDDKENIDNINPYIEIDEDELAHRLQSGEVIQKMRERPLPAPPRPPRKTKTPTREVLRDISHERNLPTSNSSNTLDSKHSETLSSLHLFEIEQQILTDDHEETITHAALVVQPIRESTALSYSDNFTNTDENLPDSPVLERIVLIEQLSDIPCDNIIQELPVTELSELIDDESRYQPIADSDDEEISEIPDEFYGLNSPKGNENDDSETANENIQDLGINEREVEEIATLHKDRKRSIPELTSNTDALIVDKEEIPEKTILEILERLQLPYDNSQHLNDAEEELEDDLPELIGDETQPPPIPPRSDSVGNLVDVIAQDKLPSDSNFADTFVPLLSDQKQVLGEPADSVVSEIPIRPPRRYSQTEKQTNDFNLITNGSRLTNTQEDECQTNLSCERSVTLPESHSNHEENIEDRVPISAQGNTTSSKENVLLGDQRSVHVSHPPQSFYNLASPIFNNFDGADIPLQQCSTCHHKFIPLSRSSSSEVLYQRQRRVRRLSEPSIPELTGQLVQSCSVEIDRSLRNLMAFVSDNFLSNTERKEDLKVILLMLVILIASLILMNGDKVEHHHHWDYFNPPKT